MPAARRAQNAERRAPPPTTQSAHRRRARRGESGGASWADVRFERCASSCCARKTITSSRGDSDSWGVGIRAIVDGAWGFAATWHTDRERGRASGARRRRHRQGQRALVGRKGDAGADGERSASGARRSASIVRRAARRARRGAARRRAPRMADLDEAQGAGLARLGQPGENDRQHEAPLLRAALSARSADAQRHRHRRQKRTVRGSSGTDSIIPRSRSASRRCAARAHRRAVHARAGAEAARRHARRAPTSTICDRAVELVAHDPRDRSAIRPSSIACSATKPTSPARRSRSCPTRQAQVRLAARERRRRSHAGARARHRRLGRRRPAG